MNGLRLSFGLLAFSSLLTLTSIGFLVSTFAEVSVPSFIAECIIVPTMLLFFTTGLWGFLELKPRFPGQQEYLTPLIQQLFPTWARRIIWGLTIMGAFFFITSGNPKRIKLDPSRNEEYERMNLRIACSCNIMFTAVIWPSLYGISVFRRMQLMIHAEFGDQSR
jgi:hypothetical protein